jgi:putative membrane protein
MFAQPPSRITITEEQNMHFPPIFGKKTVALAGAALLCGSMGMAQMTQPSTGAAGGQQPGAANPSANPSMNPQMNGMQTNGQSSPMDALFVKNALQGGIAEVQLGQLTLQKSSNDQVKQFAQKMIDDHTRLGEQMKPVAQQVGVAVPTEPSKKDRQTMAKLQALSGPAYDQAYIKDMVKDHKKDLSDFQMEASSGQDAAVKDAATQGSQIISQHLQMAQQLAKDQNVNLASK